MKRSDTIRLFCYVAALAFILFYPVRKIWQFKFPATQGHVFRFRVTAYDPYDPMRGRYVRLNLRETGQVRLPDRNRDLNFRYGQPVLAVLKMERDQDGNDRAKIVDLAADRKDLPPGTLFFLPVRYGSFVRDYDSKTRKFLKTGKHTVRLPFDRFYLNERKAPEVEKLLQKRGSKAELIVIVYPNGIYQVQNLIVNGTPVRKY